jgi:pimeloyl-ACP methyl ester carboxylesterase
MMTLRLVKPVFVRAGQRMAEPQIVPSLTPCIQYQQLHGYRQAFVYTGRGPALLLIHGIGDSSDTWQEIIPQLAQNYTVIAPDLLGHGRSDKPRADYSVAAYANGMRDLLKLLGIERVTVIGHSLGGGVAMQFAYQYPTLCERLVLASSGGVCADVSPLLRIAAAPNSELLMPLLMNATARKLTRWFVHVMRRMNADIGIDADDLMRVVDALPDPASRRAFLRTLRSVVDWRGQAITMLDRCYLTGRVPILLIWGARDAVIPMRHGQIARLAMPGSKLEVFESAGHFPFRTDPQRFIDLLDRFMKQTEPATHCADEWRELLIDGPRDRKPITDPAALNCIRASTCGGWCAELEPTSGCGTGSSPEVPCSSDGLKLVRITPAPTRKHD